MKEGKEYIISHKQFEQGMSEIIKITIDSLDKLKKRYKETKNPFCKSEIESYADMLSNQIKVLETYKIRIKSGIEVQCVVLFTDKKALFGYRGKKDLEFGEKWYRIITENTNDGAMVI